MEDSSVLLDVLQTWKRADLAESRPPPLVIEVYIDTTGLPHSQSLVLVDEFGKRWDVADALSTSAFPTTEPLEVVLERWTLRLGSKSDLTPDELNQQLHIVYKKGVVMFRALDTLIHHLPAWKLFRRIGRQAGSQQSFKLKYRVRPGGFDSNARRPDPLLTPLCPHESSHIPPAHGDEHGKPVLGTHAIVPLVTPAGRLHCRVDYRLSVSFQAVDSEALLSSRFLSRDQYMPAQPTVFGRSAPGTRTSNSRQSDTARLSDDSDTLAYPYRPKSGGYGSLGTFRAAEKRYSPLNIHRLSGQDMDRPTSQPVSEPVGGNSYEKRKLITRGVFKAGSLGDSPTTAHRLSQDMARRYTSANYDAGSRPVSVDNKPQLRSPPRPSCPSVDTAVASSGGSSNSRPTPVHRYNSSFSNRPRRPLSNQMTGLGNRSGGSGGSSDQVTGTSSAGQSDGEDIADYVSMLESSAVKQHALTRPTAARSSNTVNLSRYASLRDPAGALADDLSASHLGQGSNSITPPSRRLSNVPGLSISASPSRGGLPHQPVVRSRLSTHSIIEDPRRSADAESEGSSSNRVEEDDEPFIFPAGDVL
ncbi:hypothetical protein K470DRAFT_257831 [Piedraia hortae CBS 480.64]|uniref:Autophagy-related protein 13 n=1 Tax=Piedraia hortae CBS 480.64 TaxID=1314780 RepID=A0A6A7C0S1_9PEZI|nr:hypothetical protein K470DRAFT_257831 [Piedraia hortae CBS 480.64]